MTVDGTEVERVTLGVFGPRAHASDVDVVIALVDAVLAGFGAPGRVCTRLTEGADRLVVERAAMRDWALDVLLPTSRADQEAGLTSLASKGAFRELLAVADTVAEGARGSGAHPDDAHLAAGLAVLDRSDAVLVVWDGQPSQDRDGTAEVVAEARHRELPVAWVAVAREPGSDTTPTLELERWPWPR